MWLAASEAAWARSSTCLRTSPAIERSLAATSLSGLRAGSWVRAAQVSVGTLRRSLMIFQAGSAMGEYEVGGTGDLQGRTGRSGSGVTDRSAAW